MSMRAKTDRARDDAESKCGIIRLDGVTKSYDEGGRRKRVLDGVDLSVDAGELVVLLGRSGSGKSTLLNLIGGLDVADAGAVRVGGLELTGATERDRTLFRRRRMGIVFQFFNLIPTLTVRENILLRLELNGAATPPRVGRALDLLDDVGLGDRAGAWPDQLSGGEQQRIAVVAALAHDPDIVLADEPTGNLDLETGRRVTELLDRLTRRLGKTLVMATHAREVMGIADRVIAIRDGVVVPGAAP